MHLLRCPTGFFNEVLINLNMFSDIMLNWIVGDVNGCIVITKNFYWYLTILMKFRQNFLEPNFLTYPQTHSPILSLNTASGMTPCFLLL